MNEANSGFGENPIMMLKCVGSDNVSTAAVAIVEDMLKTVIQDFGEIMDDGVVNSWMDESYATKAYHVLEEQGRGNCNETTVEATAIEAETLLSSIMANNHSTLRDFSPNWLVDEITVLRRLPNLWIVQVFGAKFPF